MLLMIWSLIVILFTILNFSNSSIIIKDGQKFNINGSVDDILPQISELLETEGLSLVNLPDMVFDNINIMKGVHLEDVSKLIRRGDAEMWQTDRNKLSMTIVIGLKNAKLTVNYSDYTSSGFTWLMDGAKAKFDLMLVPKLESVGECTTKFQNIEILDLGKVTPRRLNKFDNNIFPRPNLINEVINYYNKWLLNTDILNQFNLYLDICKPN